jgi:precorrin-2 dehydrogenase/sirohydrochlorin ferrochelatase
MSAHLFPLFLKLNGRRCLVVGAGPISEGKIKGLLESGAHVRVVAPKATKQIARWAKQKKIRWLRRAFRPTDLGGVFLVVAATNAEEVHRTIYREAQARKILCNIVDVPPLCDFYYPAVVRRGQLQIAISTAGASPSLARRLREEMESTFGPEYTAWIEHLSKERKKVLTKKIPMTERLSVLKDQASHRSFSRFVRAKSTGARSRKKQ